MTAFKTGKPDAADTGTPFAQSARDNFWALREMVATLGSAQGFDFSHNGGAGVTPSEMYFREQTAVAAADTPSRGSGARIWIRLTLTYSGGRVTKVKYEISTDSGSTYSNWTDLAGNYFFNLDYTGRVIPFGTWATS